MSTKIENLDTCFGCGICAVACPVSLITLQLDSEGFYRPIVEKSQCTDCGICEKVCSCLDNKVLGFDSVEVKGFSGYSKDPHTRYTCSSGGIAFELAQNCIKEGGEVAAVRYNCDTHRAEHYIAHTVPELEESKGSKYMQSFTLPALKKIIKSKSPRKLIVGTPCQIDSLRRLLRFNKKEADFILLDFFCHGVPSMNIWKKYIKEAEKQIGSITFVGFRDKRFGWHDSWAIYLVGSAGKLFSLFSKKDRFYTYFLSNRILNRTCYTCKFKHLNSSADIRVGDLWGSKFRDNKEGVSVILANSTNGMKAVNSLRDTCVIKPEDIGHLTEEQMKTGPPVPFGRSFLLIALRSRLSLLLLEVFAVLPVRVLNKIKKIVQNEN